MGLIFLLTLLAFLTLPLFLGRRNLQLGVQRSAQLALPGAREVAGWDMQSIRSDPQRLEQLRGWVREIRVAAAPSGLQMQTRLPNGYLDPRGPQPAPLVWHSAFIDSQGDTVHLATGFDATAIVGDARWLGSMLGVPVYEASALPGPAGPGPGHGQGAGSAGWQGGPGAAQAAAWGGAQGAPAQGWGAQPPQGGYPGGTPQGEWGAPPQGAWSGGPPYGEGAGAWHGPEQWSGGPGAPDPGGAGSYPGAYPGTDSGGWPPEREDEENGGRGGGH